MLSTCMNATCNGTLQQTQEVQQPKKNPSVAHQVQAPI